MKTADEFIAHLETLPGIDAERMYRDLISTIFIVYILRTSNEVRESKFSFEASRGRGSTTTIVEFIKYIGTDDIAIVTSNTKSSHQVHKDHNIVSYSWREHLPVDKFLIFDNVLTEQDRRSEVAVKAYKETLARIPFYIEVVV